MTQEAAAKKDTQKLQRAIVDALEDVKAQDIAVFNTEHLSPLFERVIVASGTSNRQTKALAASVRDKVREAGFPKPRIEGEENGEWIIVDCGAAVAHIMQPAIRQYYHLEEIWGEKPVRLKFGAPKPIAQASEPEPKATAKKTTARDSKNPKGSKQTAGKSSRAAGKKAAEPTYAPERPVTGKPAPAKNTATAKSVKATKSAPSKAPATPVKAPAKKTPARSSAPVKSAAAKPAARKPAAKSPARKK
ncbi:ribosome silencing factor [Caenimonas sp. SL110]|uniref:ribosome silencing factor n=1 Tax=Caenimonas sp. SL110 TaxID=1450524 RepID=UPI0006535BBD|nr:ribosome silencing factor [Caenimonas sp. SL110]